MLIPFFLLCFFIAMISVCLFIQFSLLFIIAEGEVAFKPCHSATKSVLKGWKNVVVVQNIKFSML